MNVAEAMNEADLAKLDEDIFAQRIIHAIKRIRDATGKGVHESIELMQARYRHLREVAPQHFLVSESVFWEGFIQG